MTKKCDAADTRLKVQILIPVQKGFSSKMKIITEMLSGYLINVSVVSVCSPAPPCVQVLYNAAAVHTRLGQWDKALDSLEKAAGLTGEGRGISVEQAVVRVKVRGAGEWKETRIEKYT